MTNSKMYTDEELIEEITEFIEEIGGAVRFVPAGLGRGSGLQLYVQPQLLEQARLIVADVTKKYKVKREKLQAKNPFVGVKQFLNELK